MLGKCASSAPDICREDCRSPFNITGRRSKKRRVSLFRPQAASGLPGLANFPNGVGTATFRSVNGTVCSTETHASLNVKVAVSGARSGVILFTGGTGSASFIDLGADRKEASQTMTERLKAYGLAGIVAYGLLNTVYYTAMFTYMWTVGFKVPRGMGFDAATRKVVEVFAITWAGSQLTKAARAAGALLLAPFVDKGLGAFERAFHLKSRKSAFLYILFMCLGITAAVFGAVVFVHA